MDIKFFKSLDIKRRIGILQIFLSVVFLSIFVPIKGLKFSTLLFILFFAVLLFRFKPVPLRKYAYLTLTNSISILLYFLYGPVTAAFWIFVFLLVSDIIFGKGVFQSVVNGSAYSLSIFFTGSIVGPDAIYSLQKLFIFFPIYYIFQNGIFFYLTEFISRKTEKQDIIYIHSWEIFYYILAAFTAIFAFNVITEQTILRILFFIVGFLILRWFIRKISCDAIEGAIYRNLIKLQSDVMKKSLAETLEAVKYYSNQYVDWTGINIAEVNYDKDAVEIIYSTNSEIADGFTIPLTKGITGRCIREKQPIIVRNTESSHEYMELRENVRSEMIIPLLFGNSVIGTIDFEHNLTGAFTDKEVEYANFFASLLTYALQTHISLQPLVSTSEKIKRFTGETYKTTNEIQIEINSIQEKMKNVISGGEDQIRALNEVEKAMDELLMSHENIKTLREEIIGKVKNFINIIIKSKESVKVNIKLLDEIADTISAVRGTVEPLTTLSNNVMEIANSSKEIAEDTSLLALNASIEAERAHEHGGAFSVIAEEMNELAKTASSNTDEISKIAKTIISDIKDLTNRTSKVFEVTKNIEIASSSIMEQFDKIETQLSSIHEGLDLTIEVSNREIDYIEVLGKRIEQSSIIGNENVKFIKEINELIENERHIVGDLNEKVISIKDSMEKLRIIVEDFRLTYRTDSKP